MALSARLRVEYRVFCIHDCMFCEMQLSFVFCSCEYCSSDLSCSCEYCGSVLFCVQWSVSGGQEQIVCERRQ